MIKLKKLLRELAYYDLTSKNPNEVFARSNDEFALRISRDIVNAFKSNDKKHYREIYLDRGNDYAEFVLKVKFIKRPKQEYSHSISGGGQADQLDLTIEYNPKMFPAAMNRLVAEIKETLVHEMVHVGQQNFDHMFVIGTRNYGNFEKYWLSAEEVPAFVQGLIKRAKVTKQSLDATMEDWYRDNIRQFEFHNVSWPSIKKVWMAWAQANKDKIKKFT